MPFLCVVLQSGLESQLNQWVAPHAGLAVMVVHVLGPGDPAVHFVWLQGLGHEQVLAVMLVVVYLGHEDGFFFVFPAHPCQGKAAGDLVVGLGRHSGYGLAQGGQGQVYFQQSDPTDFVFQFNAGLVSIRAAPTADPDLARANRGIPRHYLFSLASSTVFILAPGKTARALSRAESSLSHPANFCSTFLVGFCAVSLTR